MMLLAVGRGEPLTLVVVATAGNLLGSLVNWVLGRSISALRDCRWFPIDDQSYRRATDWFARYGVWSLLLSWLPVIGDPLTVVAGALRVGLLWFILLVSIGKAARYLFIVGMFVWWNGV